MEKICTTCDETKPLEEYHRAKRGKHGRSAVCKDCTRKWSKAHRAKPETKEQKRRYAKKWYKKNPNYNRRYYEENREHINGLNRQWKIANPDYMPEYLARYLPEYTQRPEVREANRMKALNRYRSLVGQLPQNCMAILVARYGEQCMNPECDREDSILTIDHVKPVSKGGTNTMDNVQILCYTCNRQKGNRNEADYRD